MCIIKNWFPYCYALFHALLFACGFTVFLVWSAQNECIMGSSHMFIHPCLVLGGQQWKVIRQILFWFIISPYNTYFTWMSCQSSKNFSKTSHCTNSLHLSHTVFILKWYRLFSSDWQLSLNLWCHVCDWGHCLFAICCWKHLWCFLPQFLQLLAKF